MPCSWMGVGDVILFDFRNFNRGWGIFMSYSTDELLPEEYAEQAYLK
jgi:hypothetical protein